MRRRNPWTWRKHNGSRTNSRQPPRVVPAEGRLIGLVILYRKGEPPLTDEEVRLAQLIAPAVAVSAQRGTTNRDNEAAA